MYVLEKIWAKIVSPPALAPFLDKGHYRYDSSIKTRRRIEHKAVSGNGKALSDFGATTNFRLRVHVSGDGGFGY